MHRLLGNVSRRLTEAGNRINGTFAGRHFKTVLKCHGCFLNAYKYNYRNPVEAGVCQRVEDYRYSTLHGLLGLSHLTIPVVEDSRLFEDPEGCLNWLNEAPDRAKNEAVRYALKRSVFKSKKDPLTNRPILSDDDII